MKLKSGIAMLKRTAVEFSEDNVLRLSAALAYYGIFSLGPLIAVMVGVAGLALGNDEVRQQVQQALQGMLGENAAKTVDSMMSARDQGKSLITMIVGFVALLLGAAGVFGQLQDALNTIWGVKSKKGLGIGGFMRKRFLSFSMVLGIAFLLLVSLVLSAALAALSGTINRVIPMGELVGHLIDFAVSFGVFTLLFAAIFKFLPDLKIAWRSVWIGAIGTSLLFYVGKLLLGLYLGREGTQSAYGAAGSVIVILLWVYYASLILFLGAEFTQVYAKMTGAPIHINRYAVRVSKAEPARQGIPATSNSAPPEPDTDVAHAGPPAFASSRHTPGQVMHERAAESVWLTFMAGLAAGTLFMIKPVRLALKVYRKIA